MMNIHSSSTLLEHAGILFLPVDTENLDSPINAPLRGLLEQIVEMRMQKAVEELRPDHLLTIAEAAERAGVSESTIRNWVRDGKIIDRGKGRKVKISEKELVQSEIKKYGR
jgi:excisionase family DNA binding protein